ncbi:helix-turn-helix domain-containing protein [Erwinia tasmaniensis]|uniref:Type III secretion system transcriptional regulator n=1 Tax=Erwinia tasmaniensis (strain DSM 17950 / CFBP 7177 / CIP 109463 / NCPPB 4357 / Et1/99) TaxID=465817 RepID=B2VEF6_ERWT9|nr:helix-turn-helix domain-containing protein [Erwinia tasmaniensis]CAO96955.1 Type III secretion system transcriptional regulator [Erwinia tasmaniensis Et1/99]
MGDFFYQKKRCCSKKIFFSNSSRKKVEPAVVVSQNGIVDLKNSLLFARPMSSASFMALTLKNSGDEVIINQSSLLASVDTVRIKVTGDWYFEKLTMPQVAILISFLDYQINPCRIIHSKTNNYCDKSIIMQTERFYISSVNNNKRCLIGLLIGSRIMPLDSGIENFFAFMRKIENYWISHFLLSYLLNEDKESASSKLYNASKSYGVSESYFRKLCHNTFTKGPKKQLCIWRASHSVLQLIDNDSSIATIAGNNGYASSSHFSSEIKSIFGIRPREFKDLQGCFYE